MSVSRDFIFFNYWDLTNKVPKSKMDCQLDKAIKSAHDDKLFETNDIDVLMKSLKE